MKSILKLIKLEFSFLKFSILIIGIILILFSGAFLSVVSVSIDIPLGMYEYMDVKNEYLVYAVNNVKLNEASNYATGSTYGGKNGITSKTTITAANGNTFNIPEISFELESFGDVYQGAIFTRNTDFLTMKSCLIEGEIPSQIGDVLISDFFASQLKISSGDIITFNNNTDCIFTISGIYDQKEYISIYKMQKKLPVMTYYLIMEEDTELDILYCEYTSSKEMADNINRLKAKGINPTILQIAAAQIETIKLAETFFIAIALVLGIMVFFVLYSLIATFYRQRKKQICRLKLIGATNGKIASIYCIIASLLVIISVLIGSLLSLAFNGYFMNLCTLIFKNTFTSHFYFTVPLYLLISMIVFIVLLYLIYQHKIAKAQLAQEVKDE